MRLPPDLERRVLELAGETPARARVAPPRPVAAPAYRWSVTLVVPLRVVSAANAREHWAVRSRRVEAERLTVRGAFSAANLTHPPYFVRAAVTLTRLGGRRWDDDNNVSGLKGVRDEVAAWLRVDDGDPRVAFGYAQEPGGPCGVRIELTAGEDRP